ncbi:putative serine/threonine-protein kinase, partial [Danaus plexippus plexippus]
MAVLWVILILFSTGLEFSQGFPVDPTPRVYPHESSGLLLEGWSSTVLLALALILTAAVVLFGCTWCYRHKDCK